MKSIKLTQDKVTLVDDDVYEWASQFKWRALKCKRGRYCAVRESPRKLGRQTLYLHREIMHPPEDMQIDHINGDALDNRRENLRVCTCSQNGQGFKRKIVGVTSTFRGVSWFKRDQNWKAQIMLNGHKRHIGYFNGEEDAARAYNKAAKELFGEFAQMNVFS